VPPVLWGLVSTEPQDRERGWSGLLRGASEREGVRDTGSGRCARGGRDGERGAREEEGPVPFPSSGEEAGLWGEMGRRGGRDAGSGRGGAAAGDRVVVLGRQRRGWATLGRTGAQDVGWDRMN
jgi:hypothetical protein